MTKLIEYFARRSFAVNLVMLIVCFVGLMVFLEMRRDLIPSMQFNQITISASLPGASAIDMEKNVTFPIEEAINNFSGVDKITSVTRNGSSQITLSFLSDYEELSEAAEEIKARIDGLRSELPRKLDPVNVQRLRIDTIDILWYGLYGVDEKSQQDRSWVKSLGDEIRKVHGIVKVSSNLRDREVHIQFKTKQLKRLGISVIEIKRKIVESLDYAPIGQISSNEKNVSIELKKGINSLEDIASLPITSNRGGNRILLKDLANVSFAFPERRSLSLLDGNEVVQVSVFKDMDSDAIHMRNEVDKVIKKFKEKLPPHLSLELIGDGPYFIEKQLNVLKNNGLTGLVLVVISMFLFLGLRVSLMTAMGIPFAYLGTFIVLHYLNVSIDLISVVGMILVIGILVDDAIIVAEKYVQNLEKGMQAYPAAVNAATSTIIPVTGTVITTVVAFAPILFLKGGASTILYAIPCVIISSLILSWVEVFFILPNHLQHFVKTKSKRADNRFIKFMKEKYEFLLALCLIRRYSVLFVLILFTGFSLYWSTNLEKKFSLHIGSETVEVSAILHKSDSLEETKQELAELTKFLREKYSKSEVGFIRTKVGNVRIDHKSLKGYRYATIKIEISDYHAKPAQVAKRIKKEVSAELERFKTEKFEVLSLRSFQKGSEDEKDDVITVFVSGGDQLSFEELQIEIQAALKGKKHIQTLPISEERMQKSWQFYANKSELLRYQMGYSEVVGQLSEYFSKQELSQLRMEGESLTIYTKNSNSRIPEFSDLEKINVISPRGLAIPITRLGYWKKVEVLKKIEHKNLLRKFEIDVRYDKEKVEKNEVAKSVQDAIQPLVAKYPSYNFVVVKESEQSSRNKSWMLKIAITCIVLILLVLALTLNSLFQPLLIGFAIPFGIIGIIWALYFHSQVLGIMAIIGLIGMAGVVVNDSLIMVDSINKERSLQKSFHDAIIVGATGRLRSIILTTITTLGGVFPMAYGIGGESGFTQPLAFAMGWGLAFATTLTLFVLPSMIAIQDDCARLWMRLGAFIRRPFVKP